MSKEEKQEVVVQNENQKPVKPKKTHRFLWFVFGVLAAIFVPIIVVTSTVAIAGAIIKPSDIVVWCGGDKNKAFTPEYVDLNVWQTVGKFINEPMDTTCLRGIRNVTPILDDAINLINQPVQQYAGFSYEKDPIYDTPYPQLPEYIVNTFTNNAQVAILFGANSQSSNILKLVCFEKDPETQEFDYTKSRTLNQLLEPNFFNNLSKDIQVKDIVDIDSYSVPFLKAIGNVSLNNIGNFISNMTLGDLLGEAVNSSPLLKALKNVKVTQPESLDYAIKEVKVCDFVDVTDPRVEDNIIINAIKDYSINDIQQGALDNLSFLKIFDDTILVDGIFNPDADSLLMNGQWKYMLLSPSEFSTRITTYLDNKTEQNKKLLNSIKKTDTNYNLSISDSESLSALFDNFSVNITLATLDLLYEDEIYSFDNPSALNICNAKTNYKRIGDYTLEEYMNYTLSLMN